MLSLQESEKAQKSLFTWQSNILFLRSEHLWVIFPSLTFSKGICHKCCLQHHNYVFQGSFQIHGCLFSVTLPKQKTESGKYTEQKTRFQHPAVYNSHSYWKSELPSPALSFSLHNLRAFYVSPSTGTVLQTCWEKTLYFKGQVGKRQHNLHLILILVGFPTWF